MMIHRYEVYYDDARVGIVKGISEESALAQARHLLKVGASRYTGKNSLLITVKRI
tara:strand:+ start:258 stop:422 length:165 start_codon:yes stop_codon:yes gene_type:complete